MGHSKSIALFTGHLHNGENQISSENQALYRKLSDSFPNYFGYRELHRVSEITSFIQNPEQ